MKILLLLISLFCLSGCASEAIQAPKQTEQIRQKIEINLPKASEKSETEDMMLYYDGLLADKAIYRGDTVFVSPDSISDYYSLNISTTIQDTNFELLGESIYMTGSEDAEYMQANYRYLYTPEGYIVENGRLYLSEAVIEKVFGLKLTVYGDPKAVEVSTDGLSIIPGGSNYYEINYNTEDLFWLPRIIYAETRDQPMEGLIGVGNVVYNRVKHELFPDTVFEVIFDNEYAVQFTPAATGAVMGEPDERSCVAAYLCLEGYNTVGDSLYFVNPEKGKSAWFEEELQFVCSIGDHDFYEE